MTTAGRATFQAAIGSSNQGGNRKHAPTTLQAARDMPSQLHLKTRQTGQNSVQDLKDRDLKGELQEKELKATHERQKKKEDKKKNARIHQAQLEYRPKTQTGDNDQTQMKKFKVDPLLDRDDDDDNDDNESDNEASGDDKKKNQDREDSEDSDSDDSDDDSDDDEELMRELAKIKQVRELETQRIEEEKKQVDEETRRREMLSSNPLVKSDSSVVKKKWYEDSVFKNQAGSDDRTAPSRFINDPLRNDFHRKFMRKNIH